MKKKCNWRWDLQDCEAYKITNAKNTDTVIRQVCFRVASMRFMFRNNQIDVDPEKMRAVQHWFRRCGTAR